MPRSTPLAYLAAFASGIVLVSACDQTRDPSGLVTPSARRFSAVAGTTGEVAYFDGQVYAWQFPSQSSNKQNELVFDCFHLGVDVTGRVAPHVNRLYAVFLPGANQHSCPDGTEVHDHILSAIPGSPGYSSVWDLMEVWPGPSFDPSIMPITSEQALLAAATAGQVVILDDQFPLHAVVTGPAQP